MIRLEGKYATKHAGILDAQDREWSGKMPIDLAVQIRELMWEWVIVEGTAKWTRSEEGIWELIDFHISSCKPLPEGALKEDIENLCGIEGNQWKKMDDPIGFIRESRNDEDEVH